MRSPRKALFLTLILLTTLLQLPLAIGDPGWLSGWSYRKSLTIIGSPDGAQTDYQIGIFVYQGSGTDGNLTKGSTVFGKVYTEVHCQNNFGDIRFTKSDGATELDYWPEYNSIGNYAIFWVEIDSIPESPSTVDIYIYYGTPGTTATTSSMADTWTDSLDWTSNLTGSFTKYEPAGLDNDYEDDWLAPTSAELPCRLIVKRAITTIWTPDKYGTMTNIILHKNANDIRDDTEYAASRISDDTDTGADADTVGIYIDVPGLIELDNFDFTIEEYFINDILVIAETSTKGEIMSDGRASVNALGSAADAPDSLNYWGYGYGFGGGATLETFSYDAVNDIIEWGCARSGGGRHNEKSPWMVIGKYTTNEPTFGDWGSEESLILETPAYLFGAGFNASTPHVDLYWTTNLTGITLFEVQNSTDKISWTYLGSNTTAEYHDLQVVNGTERYYRVRACNLTGAVWLNSTWSDINFEKVYFISEVGEVSCKIQANNVSSIAVIAGTLNDGNLSSTYVVDGDWYNVSEVVQTPGLDVRFNFTDIAGDPNCGCLDVYHSYTGHPQHDIKIQVWNFTSSSWYQIGTLIYNETAGWECSGLGNYAEHFFQNGSFWGRFYHTNQGHTPHEVQIDRINLDVIYGEECPPCPPCEEAPALSMSKYYALAIILLILGILLGLGMRKR